MAEGVSVTLTHQVADGMHSAIIRAAKPDSTCRELALGVWLACRSHSRWQ
jgi:hypothetical protein